MYARVLTGLPSMEAVAFRTVAFPGSSAVMPLGGSVVSTQSTAGVAGRAVTCSGAAAEGAASAAEAGTPPAMRTAEAESVTRRCVRERCVIPITSREMRLLTGGPGARSRTLSPRPSRPLGTHPGETEGPAPGGARTVR